MTEVSQRPEVTPLPTQRRDPDPVRPDEWHDPKLTCDLVMKGGITSGVVYPLAITELARTYRFRCVGGSSAGAIAAAGAAAAEFGRLTGGFGKLRTLPHDLTEIVQGRNSRLFTLFQPQPGLRGLFRLVTAGLGQKGARRALAMIIDALRAWPIQTLLGATLFGLAPLILGVRSGQFGWGLVAAAVPALLGGAVGLLVALIMALRRLPAGGFGMCTGLTQSGQPGTRAPRNPALTDWLYATFQSLAGLPLDEPLTFGHLRAREITLQLMTTNLTRHEPIPMPWSGREYYFDPHYLRTLFPAAVVDHLVETAQKTPASRESAVRHALALPLLPFPQPDDLPVIVAVRMSLSFPGLISAVRLYAIDTHRKVNITAHDELTTWLRDYPTEPPVTAVGAVQRPQFSDNWFSDGGICANLPLSFFDRALPDHPTFAIDLAPYPADFDPATDLPVVLPTTNMFSAERRHVCWPTTGLGGLLGFGAAIVDTARGWVDEGRLAMPGFRDRIVTVHHGENEGGMNLNMPASVVDALSHRGRDAGLALSTRFAGDRPGEVAGAGWDNHRWVRFRTLFAAVSELLTNIGTCYRTESFSAVDTPYERWLGAHDDQPRATLPSYEFDGAQRQVVAERTRQLIELATGWGDDPVDAFTRDAPRPAMELRLMPSD